MWFRLRPDIRYPAIARALWSGVVPQQETNCVAALQRTWPGGPQSLPCLSVRSGFDLLLQALKLPRNSEVILSALTIRDMAAIVESHGLVPVPLDIDPNTFAPEPGMLPKCITPRTRLVVIAHLFGRLIPLGPFKGILKDPSILLVEDCAQAFTGIKDYTGHPTADVSLFSFGPIKTATALQGAMVNVRDPQLLKSMAALQATYPPQQRRQFFLRALKAMLLKLLTAPRVQDCLALLNRILPLQQEARLLQAAQGFAGRSPLLQRIRQKPCASLLAFMEWRFRHLDHSTLHGRQRNARRLAQQLGLEPGPDTNSHWLFPLLIHDRNTFRHDLRQHGFDTADNHNLKVVPMAPNGCAGSNECARQLVEQLTFVPIYADIPPSEIDRLASLIRPVLTRNSTRA